MPERITAIGLNRTVAEVCGNCDKVNCELRKQGLGTATLFLAGNCGTTKLEGKPREVYDRILNCDKSEPQPAVEGYDILGV